MSESIQESLEQAFAEVEGGAEEKTTEAVEEATEEAAEEVVEETENATDDTEEGSQEEVEEEPEASEDDIDPIERWDEEFKAAFETLDKKGKKLVMDSYKNFQRDYTKKSMEIADTKREYESITQAMEPVSGMLEQAGLTHSDGIRALVNAQQQLMTNPAYAIDSLVQQYGGQQAKEIVAGLASKYGIQADPDDGHADYEDPEIKALKQKLQSMEQMFQQTQISSQQQQQAEVQNQIKLFQEATDDQGNPLHPHFESVKVKMGKLISAGEATDLDDAYKKAIRLDDDLYQQELEAQRKAKAIEQDRKRKERVAAAKPAAKKPSGRLAAPEPKRKKMSIEESLEEAFAAVEI